MDSVTIILLNNKTNYLVNSKNIRYSGVTKLDQAEQWDIHHSKQSTDLRVNSYIYIKQSFEAQNFPIFTNRSRVWSINHLYHHAVFMDCEQQDKIFVIAGLNCAFGLSKSIHYSGDFVIVGFVSTYFTVIVPGFHMLFVITGSL